MPQSIAPHMSSGRSTGRTTACTEYNKEHNIGLTGGPRPANAIIVLPLSSCRTTVFNEVRLTDMRTTNLTTCTSLQYATV